MITKEKATALLDNAVSSHSWLPLVQLMKELIVNLPNEKIEEVEETKSEEEDLVKKNQEMIDNLKLGQT